MTYKAAASLLKDKDNFLILTHLNPDGDTIGSAASLCSALRRLDKQAYLFANPQISSLFKSFIPTEFFASPDYIPEFIIAVDIADVQLFPKQFNGKVDLCIDHHPSNKHYSDKLILEPDKSSCGEIVYKVITSLGLKLSATEATLLYIALSTDTGCFIYNNTNSDSFLAASKYASSGADIFKVNKMLFNSKSPERAALEGKIFSGLEYYCDRKFVIATITLEDISKSRALDSDMDNLAGLASCISGTFASATVKEIENGFCKVSLRSDTLNCSEICNTFGGGGHRAAAGCTIHANPTQAKLLLAEIMEAYIN